MLCFGFLAPVLNLSCLKQNKIAIFQFKSRDIDNSKTRYIFPNFLFSMNFAQICFTKNLNTSITNNLISHEFKHTKNDLLCICYSHQPHNQYKHTTITFLST